MRSVAESSILSRPLDFSLSHSVARSRQRCSVGGVLSTCIFCVRADVEVLAENPLAFAIRDKYPVRQLHTLILPKRHVVDSFDLSPQEILAIYDLALQMRSAILAQDNSVLGFNFGSNNGLAAGQKVMHAHFHLIPRRADESPPHHAQP